MKKIVLLSFAVIMSVSSVFAKGKNPVTDDDSATHLRTQLVSLLDDVNFMVDEDADIVVRFVINEEGEIIVLSVCSNDKQVSDKVKKQLNAQPINAPVGSTPMNVYVLPLKVLGR